MPRGGPPGPDKARLLTRLLRYRLAEAYTTATGEVLEDEPAEGYWWAFADIQAQGWKFGPDEAKRVAQSDASRFAMRLHGGEFQLRVRRKRDHDSRRALLPSDVGTMEDREAGQGPPAAPGVAQMRDRISQLRREAATAGGSSSGRPGRETEPSRRHHGRTERRSARSRSRSRRRRDPGHI